MSQFNWALDGSIVGLYLLVTMIAGVLVRRYVGKVEHFLVAGREMNIYLGIASLAATEFGIVTCMYTAEGGYTRGFSGAIPGITNFVAMWLVGYTGLCIKPLRDSNAMTVPELFERRYGKFVRWLSGVVIVLGGLLNMGVFLRVGGEFLVVACGIDPASGKTAILVVMTVLLLAVAFYTILGGMLSVLVTDFLQFVVMSAGLILVTFFVLWKVGWTQITEAVQTHYGDGGFNPFLHANLGWPFVVSNMLTSIAAVMTWQPVIARVLAARDSHTGRKVYTGTSFFFICRWIIPGLWGMAALTLVTPAMLQPTADALGERNPGLLAMPYFLAMVVPTGLMGLLIAAMLAAEMSTDSSYMLTWGGVIYNDIVGPFRRKPPTERVGLIWNRFIVACIGVFLLLWGLWYKIEGNVWEYLQITGTIYLAAMSTLLVACCYWKPANNWGAIAAIVVGAALPAAALAVNKLVLVDVVENGVTKPVGWVTQHIGDNWVNIGTYAAVAAAMVIGSLLKPAAWTKEAA